MKATTQATLDTITRRHTAFINFAELVTSTDPEYFPTLYCWRGTPADCIERLFLADAYDAEMKRRGDPRRAWRGTRPAPDSSPESDIEQAMRQIGDLR